MEERRQEIIKTAGSLFHEYGFDKTQISDIAEGMHVAQGLVYHYFKSKAEILYAVVDKLSQEHVLMTEKALSDFEGSALSCLNVLFESKPNMQGFGSLFGESMNDQGVKAYCGMRMTLSIMPLLLMLIKRGNAEGSWLCEYPGETAAFILQGISGLSEIAGTQKDEERRREAFSNILLRLLGLSYQSEPGPIPDPVPEALPRRLPKAQDRGPNNKVSGPHREDLPDCLL